MNTKTETEQKHQAMHIAEIRDLAKRFDANTIEKCMQLALENKDNPCYSGGELEEVMNVLAKASFVKEQTDEGMSLAEAIRELGKRIRAVQGE
ncbi:MAG: hypothetical protein PVF28_04260 [Thioalkalispiraceae bacterium]|jgi:hypothetical protein